MEYYEFEGGKILLYGTGLFAKLYYMYFKSKGWDAFLIGFVETKANARTFEDHRVYSLDEIDKLQFDEIHIVNSNFVTLENLLKIGIDKTKIVLANIEVINKYLSIHQGIFDIKISLMGYAFVERMPVPRLPNAMFSELQEILEPKECMLPFSSDYSYYMMGTLLAQAIMEGHVKGDIAELGVYRGGFARVMNLLFPNRTLHLFDTFEGIKQAMYQEDYKENWEMGRFAFEYTDTSVERVMKLMPHPEYVVCYKGLFPERLPDEKIEYAFVEISTGLYQSTLDGLRYFYPQMSKGGYILLAVYNWDVHVWGGVKKAVHDFEKEQGVISKVPMPDSTGALVIVK